MIELEEDLDHVVQGMLQFMYCPGDIVHEHLMGVYKQCLHDESVGHDPDNPKCQLGFYGFYIGLHELADKYDVPQLAKYAWGFLDVRLPSRHYDSLHGLGFKEFLKVIDRAYGSAGPNDDLRAVMIKFVVVRCREFRYPWSESMCGLILEHGEFAEDLLRFLLVGPRPARIRW